MEPLLGLPWHCSCYLSPNSFSSCCSREMLLQSTNRRWEEWPGDNRARWLKHAPNTFQAGSYEALTKGSEGWGGCFQGECFHDPSEPGNSP